ncbi:MAG: 3-deoxy-D-manno-octulosonic acid kinase [Salinisphaera sp.]|nr:3-deoxy-D-manno-octulosonic acid kinase [Salinisphaera sp.]
MDVQTAKENGSYLLWDARHLPQATAEHFDHEWWAREGGLDGEAVGRGTVYFLNSPSGENWVLRHFRRGGEAQRVTEDKYLWCGAKRSRAFAEWRLLAEMSAMGLPVPAPVAARVVRSGLCYRADLITARVPATQTLAERLQGEFLPAAGWQTLGQILARFHAAGICHADLNAHNILVAQSSRFWLIDFDRGRVRKPGAWCKGNVARLRRSLDKLAANQLRFHFAETDWAAMQGGYLSRPPPGG